MRIHFVGCVEIGYRVLTDLYEHGYRIDLVVTVPPAWGERTSGYTDFAPLAKRYGSALLEVEDINAPDIIEEIAGRQPDLIIVCGWQRLLGRELLSIPSKGCVGFHSSLLPRYRGRAPVNWAIIMGERETGVTMFYLDPEADAGDIIAQRAFPITLADDCRTVYEKSASAAGEILLEQLPLIAEGKAPRLHNPSRSYPVYPKRTPADGLIDFQRSALDVYNWVRALTRPYPGAFFYHEGRKVLAWRAEIGAREGGRFIVRETADLPVTVTDWEYADE